MSEKSLKDARLEIKLAPDMKAEIEGAAAAEGLTASQFLRSLFLDWQKRQAKKKAI